MRASSDAKGVGFLALSLEPDVDLVRVAAAKLGIRMTVAVAEGETLGPLGVNQVPSTVFIDREGVIVAAASGPRSREFFERRIRSLTAEE